MGGVAAADEVCGFASHGLFDTGVSARSRCQVAFAQKASWRCSRGFTEYCAQFVAVAVWKA